MNNATQGEPQEDWRQRAFARIGQLLIVAIGVFALISAFGNSTTVQAQSMEEHDAKAAFVLKLVNFVQWPEQRRELVIGFVGADATGDAFERMVSGRSIDGKGIVVRRLGQDGDLKSCQIVFVGASEGRNIPLVLDRLRGASVLTVGESDGFGQHGGIVNLLLSGGRIRFEVNPHAAQRAHLQISSRLLSLATIVGDGS